MMPIKVKGQSGAVLITTLLLMIIVLILSLSSAKIAFIDERLSASVQDKNSSLQAAESSIRDAEAWLDEMTDKPVANTNATQGVYSSGVISPKDRDFPWETKGTVYGASLMAKEDDLTGASQLPRHVIEMIGFVPDSLDPASMASGIGAYYYRITSIGYGPSANSTTVLQSVRKKRYK